MIVSFDTSSIPDGATVLSAALILKRGNGSEGTNPFTWSGNVCRVDIRTGGFNGNAALENNDFQAAATATQVATMSNPVNNGDLSTGVLNSAGRSAINKTGKTQLRVYFSTDDNNNGVADLLGFWVGEATQTNVQKLEVTYQ